MSRSFRKGICPINETGSLFREFAANYWHLIDIGITYEGRCLKQGSRKSSDIVNQRSNSGAQRSPAAVIALVVRPVNIGWRDFALTLRPSILLRRLFR